MKYDLQFILDRVKISKRTGCWLWQKSTAAGYGQFGIKRPNKKLKVVRAHRFVYELVYGKVPNKILVRHVKCRNRRCCNPSHLKAGTYTDNYYDSADTHERAYARRRGKPAHNRQPLMVNGKLYQSIIQAIKELHIGHKKLKKIGIKLR